MGDLDEQAALLARLTLSLAAASRLGNNVRAGLVTVADLDRAVLAAAFRGELLDRQSEGAPSVHQARP